MGDPKGMSSLSPMIIKLDTSRAAQLMFGRYTASAAFKFQTLLRNIRLHFQHEGERGGEEANLTRKEKLESEPAASGIF